MIMEDKKVEKELSEVDKKILDKTKTELEEIGEALRKQLKAKDALIRDIQINEENIHRLQGIQSYLQSKIMELSVNEVEIKQEIGKV